jgi:hypothetical protein
VKELLCGMNVGIDESRHRDQPAAIDRLPGEEPRCPFRGGANPLNLIARNRDGAIEYLCAGVVKRYDIGAADQQIN